MVVRIMLVDLPRLPCDLLERAIAGRPGEAELVGERADVVIAGTGGLLGEITHARLYGIDPRDGASARVFVRDTPLGKLNADELIDEALQA
jgi:hypothetical protein